MKKMLIGLACAGLWATAAIGAQNIADETPVAQDFDSIGTTATATLPTDWKTDKQTLARTLGTFAAAVSATERVDGQSVSSSAGNGIYNLGAPTDDATDRAIGWLSSSSATKSGNLYVEMVNSGATAITNLFISYNVEKYRNGSNAAGFQIQLYYSTDGATWTSAGANFLTTFPADADSSGFDTPPGATVAVSGNLDLTGSPIAASANVYLAWNYSVQSGTTTSSAQLLGVDNVSIALAGTALPTVGFSAAEATVAEDAGTYEITISKSEADGDVSGTIALAGTATEGIGADYTIDATNFTLNGATTSTTVTVTINDDEEAEAAETVVLTLTDVAGATAVSPNIFTLTIDSSDIPTHAIAIAPTTNGTVTTVPDGTADEGSTVTITATPNSGYRVASVSVEDAAANPVQVSGSQPTYMFTMPTTDATVTVSFEVYAAPDALIDFEDYAGGYASNDYVAAGATFGLTNVYAGGTDGSDRFNGTKSGRFAHLRGGGLAIMQQIAAFAQPISKINFWYANYGTEDSVTFKVQVSSDGASWTDVGETEYDPDSTTLVEGVIDAIPANMTYLQFATVDGTAGQRVSIDDVGVWFGAVTYGVTFDQTSGFEIEQGTTDVITATAANGTAPYVYVWSSTLDGAYYATNGNEFTILATAPLGDYSATVVATDSSDPVQGVTNSLNFSVVTPAVPYAISIVTNDPAYGTATTAPETEAAEGETVTVAATPANGYAVASIEVVDAGLNPVTVTGSTFTMPASAVTVTVTFSVYEGGALIISQYYEGASYDKWIEIYNPGPSAIDLGTDGYRLGLWANAIREDWKTGGTPTASIALSGTLSVGGTYLISHSSAALPSYATADVTSSTVGIFNGDDSLVLYTGETYAFANVVDVFGATNTFAADKSFVRKTNVVAGVNTDFNVDEWDEFTNTQVDEAAEATNERLGYHNTGPAVYGVTFDQTSGFEIEQGTTDVITATAANGTAPYVYVWSSTLDGAYYATNGNEFTILATAPLGDYSATVVATDSSDPVQGVTNSLNFSVVTPAVPYAISIVTNDPAYGTVTTDPATEAVEGATVTVTATPAASYAVGSIVVNGGAVTVTGNTFTMPAEPATVTVTFVLDIATLPIGESYTATMDWTTLAGWSGVSMSTYSDGDMSFNASADALTVNFDAEPGELTFTLQGRSSTAGTAPMQFLVEESANGTDWTQVVSIGDGEVTTSVTTNGPYTLASTSRYVRWTLVNKYLFNVGLNDVSITSGGPAVFGVSVNKANGFEVTEGSSDAITATAANGTEPYVYGWTSTLGGAYYTANENVFTILATAPTGSYSATVTATDATPATASNTVTFSVVGLAPGQPAVVISGSLSSTVGTEMALSITATNATVNAPEADNWYIDLKDPDGLDDYSYGFAPPAFTLTPTKAGTYTLTATADTDQGTLSNGVQLVVSGGGGSSNAWTIGDVGGGGAMSFTPSNQNVVVVLPTNYTLNAVYGSDASGDGLNNLGQGVGALTVGVDYTWTPATRTVNILSTTTNRRFIRIGATP